MAADGAPHARESVRDIPAPEKSFDGVLPVSLPRAIGSLEAVPVNVFELLVVLDDEPLDSIGEIPCDMFHPLIMRIRSASCKMNAASGELHDKEQVVRNETALCPDLDRCEVDCPQDFPVGLPEGLPRCLSFAIRCRFNAVVFQYVADPSSCVGEYGTICGQCVFGASAAAYRG